MMFFGLFLRSGYSKPGKVIVVYVSMVCVLVVYVLVIWDLVVCVLVVGVLLIEELTPILMGFPADAHLGLRHDAPIGSAKSMANPGNVSSSNRSAANMCRFNRFEIANADDEDSGTDRGV